MLTGQGCDDIISFAQERSNPMAYDSFSRFYDILMADAGYDERAAYYREILRAGGVESGILLDLGCGTGNMSVRMADYGFEVIGVDSSVGMLSRAREKIQGRNILLLNQSMEELDLYGTVNCTISALDCINHLDGAESVQRAFEKVSLFTEPGGLFVFDVNTVYKHRNILADRDFVLESDGLLCCWRNALNPDDSVDILLDFFEEKDGAWYRESEEFTERAYEIETLSKLLEQAGFKILHIYDDLTFDSAGKTSARAVFAAEKR